MQETRGRADLTGTHHEADVAHRALAPWALFLICAVAAWVHWGKIIALEGLDQSWWLGCLHRFVQGELPYRDFLWHYPPLSLAALGYASRWFGSSYTLIQIVVDLWSATIVLLLYLILKRFLPGWLLLLSGALTVVVCATTRTYFALFYIPNYAHALLTAAIGVLLLLLGCLRHLEDRRRSVSNGLLIGGGAFVALLSKQEAFVAMPGMLVVLAFLETRMDAGGWSWKRLFVRGAVLGALCIIPAAIVYAVLGQVVGYGNLWASFLGYGVASGSCPWWPTGIGILGAAAALGCAAAFVAAASLADRQAWRNSPLGRYYRPWLVLFLGSAAYAAFVFALYGELILRPEPWPRKLSVLAPLLLSSSTFLRPLLWGSIFYWIWLLISALRRPAQLHQADAQTMLLLSPAILMGIRSLFGSILSAAPEVPAIAYPFLLALAPLLMARALTWPYRTNGTLPAVFPRHVTAIISATLIAYIAVRIVGGYVELRPDREYTTLHTRAGQVKIKDGEVDAEIYRYVAEHTSPSDTVISLPLGGGIGFALERASPLFSTLFIHVRTSPQVRQRDLDQFRNHPPAVIVAASQPHYGTSYGVQGCVGCTFPYLRWMPYRVKSPEDTPIPVIKYIEENYRLDRTIGPWSILLPLRQQRGATQ